MPLTRIRGDVIVDGDVQVNGDMTSTMAEDIAFGATEFDLNGATLLRTNQTPRIELPAAVTTQVYVGGFNFPSWYLEHGVDLHVVYTNEGAGAQQSTWGWNLRQTNMGQAMSAGTLISTGLANLPTPGNGVATVAVLDSDIQITPGGLGYILGLEIGRIGGADSLANSIGLVAVGFAMKTA